ncbi:hypothetical protein FIA58_002910 [Flavobacterium jejuense]|uniref:Uncharacterized protein n=1 Tax=Flavobacterium jejuense TaxID=1544455 RepID=A0ABX0IN23_9FLAO|nr:hypothetical protein [Flavobacterium jejuense]NHN24616.1 hypothetical protein [Flavobacterium jejuense]
MKLESLKENKFKDAVLKREQMFTLNGGGTKTGGGINCYVDQLGQGIGYEFGYDVDRIDENGNAFRTYHDRSHAFKTLCIE